MEQLVSLSKIFSEKVFRIPDYQRGYAWTTKEVGDFWSDLCRLEINKNHYVGVLTLEPVDVSDYSKWIDDTWIIEAKKYVPFYIVDGQQRLTTSIILICVILEVMKTKEIKKLNYTPKEEITRKYIYEHKDENNSRTYIFGYECNNPSYDFLVSNIYCEACKKVATIEETIYTSNLENAKKFFYGKVLDLSIDQLECIYTKISQNFLFNMYTISSDIDVHVTFETMNNRGKPLSNLELLKNRLIYISTLFESNESDKERLRRDINACWKKIYHILGKSKEKRLLDDEFLVTHFMLYFCNSIEELEKNSHKYYSEFGEWQSNYLLQKHFIASNIFDRTLNMTECFKYIESLNNCIELWENIKNPTQSKLREETIGHIEKINYLSIPPRRYYRNHYLIDFSYTNVFILACFKACKDEDTLLKYLKSLEKYLFVVSFFESDAIEDANIDLLSFSEIVIKLNKGDMVMNGVIDKLDKVYIALVTSAEVNKRTTQYYSRNGFYRTAWLRYFLCEYEQSLMRKSKAQISKLNIATVFERGYNSIEHIYPENSHYQYWLNLFKVYSTKQRNALKNSLGNFVAISIEKNSKLGNLPFSEKKSNSHNTVGYKYGTYAEIEIAENDDWGASEILNRGIKLTNFLYERWGVKIGSGRSEEKKQFLGLDFVKS